MSSSLINFVTTYLDDSEILKLNFHPEVIVLAARINDNLQQSIFTAEEEIVVSRAVLRRRNEFRAGRNLARIALQSMDISPCAIPSNEDRSPRWPRGVCGSISHTNETVVVAVTTTPTLVGLGIDVEESGNVDSELRTMIQATENESKLDATLLFSAKEAVFKAVFPIFKEFLKFSDITIYPTDGGFISKGRLGLLSTAIIKYGFGRIVRVDRLVITGFFIPQNARILEIIKPLSDNFILRPMPSNL